MKNRSFYMGVECSGWNSKKLEAEAETLLRTGLFAAGYRTLFYGGDYCDKAEINKKLAQLGFGAGISFDIRRDDETEFHRLISEAGNINCIRFTGIMNQKDLEKALKLRSCFGEFRFEVEVDEHLMGQEKTEYTENIYIKPMEGIEHSFLETTRHLLDSCIDEGTTAEAALSTVRARKMAGQRLYSLLPMELKFDHYANQALYANYLILGCPLVLGTSPSGLTEKTVSMLCDGFLRSLTGMEKMQGEVAHYYDPWHVLYKRRLNEQELLLLALNRCHGDTPMDIIPKRDFPEMNMESFSVYDCLEGRLCAEKTSFFSFYAETSDHPGTPCCRLLLVKSV